MAKNRYSLGYVLGHLTSKALHGEETSNYELPLYTKSGDRVEVLLSVTTRRDADCAIVGVVGVGQDITAMKAAHAEKERMWSEKEAAIAEKERAWLEKEVAERERQRLACEAHAQAAALRTFDLSCDLVARRAVPQRAPGAERDAQTAAGATGRIPR